jgi:hypothetical protein
MSIARCERSDIAGKTKRDERLGQVAIGDTGH